jgi:hypothetical protein
MLICFLVDTKSDGHCYFPSTGTARQALHPPPKHQPFRNLLPLPDPGYAFTNPTTVRLSPPTMAAEFLLTIFRVEMGLNTSLQVTGRIPATVIPKQLRMSPSRRPPTFCVLAAQ